MSVLGWDDSFVSCKWLRSLYIVLCAPADKSAGGLRWISCVVHGGVVVYRQTSISNDEMENKNDCHTFVLSF